MSGAIPAPADITRVIERTLGIDYPVTADMTMAELNCDSIDVVEIACELEYQFDINLPWCYETKWRTVADIIKTAQECA